MVMLDPAVGPPDAAPVPAGALVLLLVVLPAPQALSATAANVAVASASHLVLIAVTGQLSSLQEWKVAETSPSGRRS